MNRGVACLKFHVHNCGGVVNATLKKGVFANSVDPDETPKDAVTSGSTLFAMLSTFMVTWAILNFICHHKTPTKIGIRYIRIAFPHTYCMCILKKPSELE